MSLNNKPTHYQLLKQTREQLRAALEKESAKDELIAALQLQLSDRDQHIGSLQQIIELLNQALAEKETLTAELESRAMLLEQANTNLSEKLWQQDSIIADMQREMIADKKQLAKQAKNADILGAVRHGKKLLADERYGRKSERTHEPLDQAGFIAATGLTAKDYALVNKLFAAGKFANISEKPNPKLLEQGLEVVEKVLLPPGIDTSLYKSVGTKDTYKIVRRKASNYILKIIRPIFLEETDKQLYKHKQLIAPLPEGHINRCTADISLLNLFLTDKFLYHMPLNRIRTKLIREGLTLPYSTINKDTNRGARMLTPLWDIQLREAVTNGILHCDETTIRVLDKSKPLGKKSHNGQMLVMVNPLQKFVCFKYIRGRGHKDMDPVLTDFKGYLHTDGYGGYKKYGAKPGILHGKCLIHARRKFIQCNGTPDFKLAFHVLKYFIAPIYANERTCTQEDLDPDEIFERRQRISVPLLKKLHEFLLKHQAKVKPNGPMAEAIKYTLNIWDGIMLYCTEGFLLPDNNIVERQIRPLALGKHSWLFSGSHEAAPNAAIMYTFFGTCQLHGINPEIWLTYALSNIQTYPKNKLADLLPQNCKHLRDSQVTPYQC